MSTVLPVNGITQRRLSAVEVLPTDRASWLAQCATRALREEAELTPKPGLVDRRGSGAHADMNLGLLLRSAAALQPTFLAVARAAWNQAPSPALRAELGALGREGERRMLEATGGVNTHRGAIWTLGLLVAGAAMGGTTPKEIADGAGELARLDDFVPRDSASHGSRMERRHGVAGARGEARQGFPHILELALPQLRSARSRGANEPQARLAALLAMMSALDDTCLLHRGGPAGLALAKAGARRVLELGGPLAPAAYKAMMALDAEMLSHGLSPGGSADLLAGTLFLDFVDAHRDRRLSWKN